MRVHKINNVNKALDFIASKGVKLVSIGAEGESGCLGGLIQATLRGGKACRPAPAPPCHRDPRSLPAALQRDAASWCGGLALAPERRADRACLRFA